MCPEGNHCGKRSWSTTITRMFGLRAARKDARERGTGRAADVLGAESLVASATALIPTPAPARSPPARSPPFRKLRRSTLLCCSGSMLSIRALILGPAAAVVLGLAAGSAAAGPPSPQCTPASLNNSALQGGSVTISPLPGSRDARPQTQISFLGVSARALGAVSVIGSRSGAHAG